jgi:hypothetical protein
MGYKMVQRFSNYLLTEAGAAAERQETGLVDAVNQAVDANMGKPITIISKDATIKDIVKAEKFQGRQESGSEPYTDVQFLSGKGPINLSMKGTAAPSLAGGGLRGIEAIIPGLAARFFRTALDNHMKNKLAPGSKVPDTFAKLNNKDKKLLVIGNRAIGGPIDFMYIGPMDVKSTYKSGTLKVNGNLTSAKKFTDTHDLYFRLRARRHDQPFAPDASDKAGMPKIYGKSPSRGDSAGRLVISDKPPKDAKRILTF